jgi:lysyl-tRNA synthetase, class II
MDLTEECVKFVAQEVNGNLITHFDGHEIDLSKWQRYSMREAIQRFWPVELGADAWQRLRFDSHDALAPSVRELHQLLSGFENSTENLGTSVPHEDEESLAAFKSRATKAAAVVGALLKDLERQSAPLGKIIAELFEILAEPHLIQPTIIYDFPLAVSPLSKQKPDEPDWVERFEFYIGGFELGNAFSELNDPEEQRKRFEQQIAQRLRGDDEAHQMDEDYVRALAYGLPPTGGEGIGIDRLTMVLTGASSIRDVILFPLLRPRKAAADTENEQPQEE